MTEEEHFRKYYPDFCYGDKPLSPYWDFFQDGIEFGERQSEKKIEELEKENEELEKELKDANEKIVHLACNQNKDLKRNITKAKELLKRCYGNYIYLEPLRGEIGQFLKEIEK